jgi:hypothetical protein
MMLSKLHFPDVSASVTDVIRTARRDAVPERCEFATLRPQRAFQLKRLRAPLETCVQRVMRKLRATSIVMLTRGNLMKTIRIFAIAAAILITALIFGVIADSVDAEVSIDTPTGVAASGAAASGN